MLIYCLLSCSTGSIDVAVQREVKQTLVFDEHKGQTQRDISLCLIYIYLRQGDYVIALVCLFVC